MSASKTQATAEVIQGNFGSEPPVTVDFNEARTPKSEIAKKLAAEAEEHTLKLKNADSKAKKAGSMKLLSTSTAGEVLNMNPYLIQIKEGWNSRQQNDPSNLAHIDMLAKSIASIGVQQALVGFMENDQMVLTDGHCRLFATFRAIEVYGAEIKSVPIRSENRFATEADRILSQIVRNSGKSLNPYEMGTAFVKMMNFGWTEQDIADKIGLGVARVKQILDLMADTTDNIKNLMATGQVSPSSVEAVMRATDGDVVRTEEILQDSLELAAEQGKTRATAKHISVVMENEVTDGDTDGATTGDTDGDTTATTKETKAEAVAKESTLAALRRIMLHKNTDVEDVGSVATIKMDIACWKEFAKILKI